MTMNGNPMQMGNMLKVELALDARYFRNPNDAAEGRQVWVGHADEGRACPGMKLCVYALSSICYAATRSPKGHGSGGSFSTWPYPVPDRHNRTW